MNTTLVHIFPEDKKILMTKGVQLYELEHPETKQFKKSVPFMLKRAINYYIR